MIIEQQTVSILQNFQTINQSIVINEGDLIRTLSPSKTVFAQAKVPNIFPLKFGIFDLSRFIGILSLNKQSEINFNETYMDIVQGTNRIKYTYCEPSLIVSPPETGMVLKNSLISFNLPEACFNQVIKAMQILGFNEIEIRGEDGKLSIAAISTKNQNSDTFQTMLGETDKNFSAIIDADKLKLISQEYNVTISNRVAYFKGSSIPVEYWIALSAKSNFE